jgi:hypothetical protein
MHKFRIPQEVQVEDKIFGPITMRRLIILTVGGGLTYMVYLSLKNFSWIAWGFPIFFLSSFTLALSFLEVFGMRFEKLLIRLIEFLFSPRIYLWDKRYTQDSFFKYIHSYHNQWLKISKNIKPENSKLKNKLLQKQKVKNLSMILEKDLSMIDVSKYKNKK